MHSTKAVFPSVNVRFLAFVIVILATVLPAANAQINTSADTPLRVIAIFAHPDDAESKMGGTAALMAQMGHEVKFLSLTNGNAGHQSEGGGPLANRRRAEASEAAKNLGIAEYEVFDNHDGELLPELHIRQDVIRAIREWNADVVFGLRPNDYHPDHRNAGQLVIDASYMVIVPNVAPDTPPLPNNPVFFYMQDGFQKPNPLSHDVVVGVDEVIDIKLAGLDAHTSQMYEWLPWTNHTLDSVPENPDERVQWLKNRWMNRQMSDTQRAGLEKWYGSEKAAEFRFAESFEIAEYGRRPTEEDLKIIFPMLGQ